MPDPLLQPAWPLRFVTRPDGTVGFADCVQASAQDRMSRAAIVVCTPKDHRDDAPSFGVSELQFQQGHIDTDRLVSEIQHSDQALAGLEATEIFDALSQVDATRRVVSIDVGEADA
jgi:hypothetical protein